MEIKVATNQDISVIIKMLKQTAQWMKDNDINQWRFLLDGGDDGRDWTSHNLSGNIHCYKR